MTGSILSLTVAVPFLVGGGDDRFEELRSAFQTHLRVGKREEAYGLLERMRIFDSLDAARFRITVCLSQDDPIIFQEALEQIAATTDPEALDYLVKVATQDPSWEVRAAVVMALGRKVGDGAEGAILQALQDRKWQVQAAAIRALGLRRNTRSIQALIGALKTTQGRLRMDILLSLRRLTGKRIEAEYPLWYGWWESVKATYTVPSEREAAEAAGEKVDIRTAVKEGFYERIYSERVIFLVDISASMRTRAEEGRSRMEVAKAELRRVIENQMSEKTHFNVILFSSHVTSWKPAMVRATPRALRDAAAFVQTAAPAGETNTWGALQAAFADANCDTIYVLSDGYPTEGEVTIPDVIALRIRDQNRHRAIVIHTIAFLAGKHEIEDKEAARGLMEDLAEGSGGFFKEIIE